VRETRVPRIGVSLSVDPPEVNAAFRAGLGARWTFLSDPNRQAQTQLRLRETTGTLNEPYVAAEVVISPGLRIHAAYNGYWYDTFPADAFWTRSGRAHPVSALGRRQKVCDCRESPLSDSNRRPLPYHGRVGVSRALTDALGRALNPCKSINPDCTSVVADLRSLWI
jgi:hypothetical protein